VACLRTSVWMSLSTPAVTMATTFTRRKIGISDFINDYNLQSFRTKGLNILDVLI
jgi:hypothetical protein